MTVIVLVLRQAKLADEAAQKAVARAAPGVDVVGQPVPDRYQRDEGDETDLVPEGLGYWSPREHVSPADDWSRAERLLFDELRSQIR